MSRADLLPAPRDSQLIRLQNVLPFFAPAELSGLADYLERRLAERIARLPRSDESARRWRRGSFST